MTTSALLGRYLMERWCVPWTKSVATAGVPPIVPQNPFVVVTAKSASPPGSRKVVFGVPGEGEVLGEADGELEGDAESELLVDELGEDDGDDETELDAELEGDELTEPEGDGDVDGDDEGDDVLTFISHATPQIICVPLWVVFAEVSNASERYWL